MITRRALMAGAGAALVAPALPSPAAAQPMLWMRIFTREMLDENGGLAPHLAGDLVLCNPVADTVTVIRPGSRRPGPAWVPHE